MPKVAVLIKNLAGGGGLEKDSWYCALSFAKAGCDVTILTTGPAKPGPWMLHEGIEIISLGTRPFLSVSHIRSFDRAARAYLAHNPHDLTFGLDQNTELNFIRAGNGSHAMALEQRAHFEGMLKRLSFRINPLHRTLLRYEAKAMHYADLRGVFTNSEMIRTDLINRYNLDPQSVRVVYNGVEWGAYAPAFDSWEQSRPQLLEDEGLSPNDLHLVFVGSGFARKGLLPLLKAMSYLRWDPVHLSVIGKDKHMNFYKKFCESKEISSRVRFFGQRSATPFYQIADWCVIPSYYDPCANVTSEALAMGVPVISSKFNGGHELLRDGRGLVIDDLSDHHAIAHLIKEAISRYKTPENARVLRTAMEPYEFEKQFAKMTEVCLASL